MSRIPLNETEHGVMVDLLRAAVIRLIWNRKQPVALREPKAAGSVMLRMGLRADGQTIDVWLEPADQALRRGVGYRFDIPDDAARSTE